VEPLRFLHSQQHGSEQQKKQQNGNFRDIQKQKAAARRSWQAPDRENEKQRTAEAQKKLSANNLPVHKMQAVFRQTKAMLEKMKKRTAPKAYGKAVSSLGTMLDVSG
jgi:molecular chaperone GrpE (heat shock protein)